MGRVGTPDDVAKAVSFLAAVQGRQHVTPTSIARVWACVPRLLPRKPRGGLLSERCIAWMDEAHPMGSIKFLYLDIRPHGLECNGPFVKLIEHAR